ncbi:MAG: F0F1 ATP synthase subunit B [Bacteroidales bacterium]
MDLITPDFGLFFWMLVTFMLVFMLLKKFAWKPIIQALREREENIKEGIENAEEAKNELANVKVRSDQIISDAIVERDKLIRQGRELKDKITAEARDEAGEEAKKIVEAARKLIEEEKTAALNQIKAQIASLSVDIAEKILRQKLEDDTIQQELMTSLLDEFKLN